MNCASDLKDIYTNCGFVQTSLRTFAHFFEHVIEKPNVGGEMNDVYAFMNAVGMKPSKNLSKTVVFTMGMCIASLH